VGHYVRGCYESLTGGPSTGAATLILAFLAGALTILSPCVLPLAPIVIAGARAEDAWGHSHWRLASHRLFNFHRRSPNKCRRPDYGGKQAQERCSPSPN
jgi:hypothetical protein